MTASNSYIPRNPKFTDSFERELTNDTSYNIGRDEPSQVVPFIQRTAAAVIRAVQFLRRNAQQPVRGYSGS